MAHRVASQYVLEPRRNRAPCQIQKGVRPRTTAAQSPMLLTPEYIK